MIFLALAMLEMIRSVTGGAAPLPSASASHQPRSENSRCEMPGPNLVDQPLDQMIDVVGAREKFANHGTKMMQNLTLCHRLAASERRENEPRISEHVCGQLRDHNERFAIRVTDIIDPNARKRPKFRGRGRSRKWVGPAVLRSVYGNGYTTSTRKRKRASNTPGHVDAPATACSARATARFNRSSHKHVQSLRNACALRYMTAEGHALRRLPLATRGTITISFDESEQPTWIDGQIGIYDMLVIHAELKWTAKATGLTREYQITVPPAWLKDKTSDSILNSVLLRLPIPLEELKKKADIFTVLPNSDSARAMKKIGRKLKSSAKLEKHIVEGHLRAHWLMVRLFLRGGWSILVSYLRLGMGGPVLRGGAVSRWRSGSGAIVWVLTSTSDGIEEFCLCEVDVVCWGWGRAGMPLIIQNLFLYTPGFDGWYSARCGAFHTL
jgi:hypothetical protein